MNDRPQDRTEDRRRRGPLGDEEGTEETRRVPQGGQGGGSGSRPGRSGDEEAPTRQVSPEDAEREDATRENATRAGSSEADTASRRAPGREDPETHVIRTPGAHEEEDMPYTR